ncbi:unnamed protein product [Rotaria magnacalcarata]|uniref:Uncharacterized protein n=3 Tax=Rotaria magnacalcarata TaxID=392030 RepID=A0A815JSS9_9BILA|nr:unnamed protein product [Rotaria magnacalcarata]CAF1386341.1 unnamed protein product [Rotaria magnacalcarata]
MDDPSLLPFLNNNGNGHHYSINNIDDEIEHEEDELEDDDDDDDEEGEDNHEEEEEEDVLQSYDPIRPYPEDEIDEDEIEEDDIDDEENQDAQEIVIPQPPPAPQQQHSIQSERGGRRKGVPRRLQLSPQIAKSSAPQRLLPLSSSKSSSNAHHHHDQPILTSDQEDNNEITDDFNNENHIDEYYHNKQQNCVQLDLLPENLIDNNHNDYDENNNNYHEEDSILEIVDDVLADIVTNIVQNIRQQRQKNFKPHIQLIKTNGYSNRKPSTNGLSKSTHKHEQKLTNGKHHMSGSIHTNSIKSSKSQSQSQQSLSSSKLSDSSALFNEFTKMMHLNSQQQLVKQKQSLSSSSFSSPPSAKRQKTSETLSSSQPTTPLALQQQQHQQLLWQMTQQLMMSTQVNDTDTSSLLKQQLLGLTPPGTVTKRVGRPPKQHSQPQIMRSSTNMIPPTNTSPFERGNFAPRRRGRPPKYVTERGAMPGLSSHDLDPSSYDQLFAAIENSVTGNSSRTSSAAFQSALASMLGHQAGLSMPSSIPSSVPAVRNGAPASMVKQSAGQTRHSLPASSHATKLSHAIGGTGNGLDMPLMATKKRGPGRPPKSQLLLDSHQVLQATKRMNSSSSLSNNSSNNNNNNNNNNFAPTMVPSSPTSFNFNAAFVDMLQQQQHPH